jgi:2-amino-4-hydroxy-6-hydroxymethyldihydropteridine diphosphokinase
VTRALVALGSNLEPRRERLLAAVRALGALPGTRLLATSTLRDTAPVDCPPGSGPFLNGACLLETELPPRALLRELQRLEAEAGRERVGRHAPRTLDLDLVLHGEAIVREPDLVLPHPRCHERAFVLEPAAEIAPSMRHPLLRCTLAQLRDALAGRDAAAGAGGEAAACAP